MKFVSLGETRTAVCGVLVPFLAQVPNAAKSTLHTCASGVLGRRDAIDAFLKDFFTLNSDV